MRWTEEEYQAYLAKRQATVSPSPKAKKKNKYGAKKCWVDGLHFDSLREADYYNQLKVEKAAGLIAGYIVHGVMVCITGGDNANEKAVTYEPDFVVLHNDGTYEIIDTKSDATVTPLFKNKMKALKEKFPDVEIHLQK